MERDRKHPFLACTHCVVSHIYLTHTHTETHTHHSTHTNVKSGLRKIPDINLMHVHTHPYPPFKKMWLVIACFCLSVTEIKLKPVSIRWMNIVDITKKVKISGMAESDMARSRHSRVSGRHLFSSVGSDFFGVSFIIRWELEHVRYNMWCKRSRQLRMVVPRVQRSCKSKPIHCPSINFSVFGVCVTCLCGPMSGVVVLFCNVSTQEEVEARGSEVQRYFHLHS